MDIDMLYLLILKVILSDTWADIGNMRPALVWRWKVLLVPSRINMLVLRVQWDRTWTQASV